MMKKATIMTSVFVLGMSTQASFADYTPAKRAGTFFTSAIAGAVVGGPVGFIAGALGGVWLSEEIKQASKTDVYEKDLVIAADKMIDLNSQLLEAKHLSETFAKMAMEPFELQMLFKTNQSELTPSGVERVNQVAKYLSNNPKLSIRLDGYADPRGNTNDNLMLSEARVRGVATELEQHGLDPQRIISYSHGSSLSQATEGDYDAYALERVVKIKLFRSHEKPDIAQNNVRF